MVDLGEDEETFGKFMTPLSTAFNHLKSELADGKLNAQTSQSVIFFNVLQVSKNLSQGAS